MVSEAVEAGDDGGGGKGRLAGLFGVDWGFYGAAADAGGGGGYLGIVVRERERFVGGLGEGKWIALMDMVGREGFFFFFALFLLCFFFVIDLEMRNFEWYSKGLLIHICDIMSFLHG